MKLGRILAGMREAHRAGDLVKARLVRHQPSCLVVKVSHLPEAFCDCNVREVVEFRGPNIITSAGDIYYAQVAVRFANGSAPSPTNSFNTCYLGVAGGAAPGKSSTITSLGTFATNPTASLFSGYPISADTDPDNSGAGASVATWKFFYSAANGIGTISDAGIGKSGETQGNGAPLLNHLDEASFPGAATIPKTAFDTLTFWFNHTMLGV